jgi:hypothetical protein
LERHSSGLCSLGEVLREVVFQSLVNEIFCRAATGFWTVPIYGVIDLGFDARTNDGRTLPAGLLVRRAHRRPPGGVDLPACGSVEERTKLEIELLLRHYGLTSSNRGSRFRFERGAAGVRVFYGGEAVTDLTPEHREVILGWLRGADLPLECDGVNIQLTREVSPRGPSRAQLVDFGQFEMRPRFDDPLVSLARDRLLRWSASIWPDDPGFVQPLPALCVPEARWGFGTWQANDRHRPRRSETEGPSKFAHLLARGFRAGHLTGAQVHAELDRFIADSIARW